MPPNEARVGTLCASMAVQQSTMEPAPVQGLRHRVHVAQVPRVVIVWAPWNPPWMGQP